MKKTFPLTHPRIKPERLVDSVRAEVNKYLKRERGKKLPEGSDFWDFDCKVGPATESSEEVHVSKLSKAIGDVLEAGAESCYVEILARPRTRIKKQAG